MCAIAGIISQLSDYHQAHFLTPVLKAMEKRGPDASHIDIFSGRGCFGHNRLSIIDLHDRAKQPMWDHTHRYCLSFNGEIYNFPEIRQELIQRGRQFRTTSDSEVLIESWAEWGVKAIDRFVGMFAFAIWDNQSNELYLVRDRMGEKPLYYAPIAHAFTNGLVFASELKGLLRYPFINKQISMPALSHYLGFNYTATEASIFDGVYKLPPASYLRYDLQSHEVNITEYWSLASAFKNKTSLSFHEAKRRLDELLKITVQDKMTADVPLGAFLSGGIDSSTIVSYMCQKNISQVNTYSIGFHEKTYSELDISKQTAEHLGVNHFTKIVTPDITQLLPQLIYAYDEPFADTSLIPTYLLCEFARQSVTVSLSGDGGDELFGGYPTYQADRYYQLMQRMPAALRMMLYQASHHLPVSFNKVSLDYKIKQFLRGSLLEKHEAHVSWREVFSHDDKHLLIQTDYQDLLAHHPKQYAMNKFKDVEECDYLDQAMYVDMKTWLVDDILLKVDRASMAHSMEVRAPFLDHRLVEFAASLPVSYKIQRRHGKRLLKANQKNRLPRRVLRQPKRGFNSPISHWLAHDLYEMAYDVTTSSHLMSWFNKSYIEKLWRDHVDGTHDNGHRLFNLLCLGLWRQYYL